MYLLTSLQLRSEKVLFKMLLVLLVLIATTHELWTSKNKHEKLKDRTLKTHLAIINKFRKDREKWTTSGLGSWLFKHNKTVSRQKKVFVVLVSKGISLGTNHFQGCSVRNCYFFKDNRVLPVVDAVFINLHYDFFTPINRRPQQIWIFFNSEPPIYALKSRMDWKDLANIFNWSMSYRTESDIPYPYGRTLPLEKPVFLNFHLNALTGIIPNWERKRRDVLVTILMSHCLEFRMDFITNLQKNIPVDVFGHCSRNNTIKYSCPGHYGRDCDLISVYLFYLALENSACREYLTEKIWYNAYLKGAIPIIMGPSLSDCQRLLPPKSFIYVPINHNHTTIEHLAQHIMDLSKDENALLSLHEWRNHFNVTFDYGYFDMKSAQLCRLCEGLNYNNKETKIYNEEDMRLYLDPQLLCGK